MANEYLDFGLHIWSEGEQCFAQVTESPIGCSRREPLEMPFLLGKERFENLKLKLENAVLRSRDVRRGPISAEEQILRQFGSRMFRAVFKDSASVAQKFDGSLAFVKSKRNLDGLRIKLTIDSNELSALPWEYVFDEACGDDSINYLCLRQQSPVVRFLDVDPHQEHQPVPRPLRILGMIANPRGDWKPLNSDKERIKIEEAVENIPDIELEWVRGDTQDDLMDMIRTKEWHVFHFIGHGGVQEYVDGNGRSHTEGYIVLGDGEGGGISVSAGDIALTLQFAPSLRLVVLNCCESGSQGPSSPGSVLVKFGVPSVVAMQYPIRDEIATCFASRFYSYLIDWPIEKALTAARLGMLHHSRVEWAIPVLFTRSNVCTLVESHRQPPAARRSENDPPSASRMSNMPAPVSKTARSREQARNALRALINRQPPSTK